MGVSRESDHFGDLRDAEVRPQKQLAGGLYPNAVKIFGEGKPAKCFECSGKITFAYVESLRNFGQRDIFAVVIVDVARDLAYHFVGGIGVFDGRYIRRNASF